MRAFVDGGDLPEHVVELEPLARLSSEAGVTLDQSDVGSEIFGVLEPRLSPARARLGRQRHHPDRTERRQRGGGTDGSVAERSDSAIAAHEGLEGRTALPALCGLHPSAPEACDVVRSRREAHTFPVEESRPAFVETGVFELDVAVTEAALMPQPGHASVRQRVHFIDDSLERVWVVSVSFEPRGDPLERLVGQG